MNISGLSDAATASEISDVVGQMSFKNPGAPAVSVPSGSVVRSMSIRPAMAYATTNIGDAK